MNKKRIYTFLILILIMTFSICNVAFADTKKKKKISNVSIKVTGNIEVNSQVGNESIEFTSYGKNYQIESAELENPGFSWSLYDTPIYKITLAAEDGYIFNIRKASNIKLNGATYLSAYTENDRTNQIIRVKLKALKDQANPVKEIYMNEDGLVTWKKVGDYLTYELRLYKGSSLIGDIIKTNNDSYDFKEDLQNIGEYFVKIRTINKNNPDIASSWLESNRIFINQEKAIANREWYDKINTGVWGQTSDGKYYYMLANNNLARNEWRKIKGEWYYFDDSAYMVTGWVETDGKWYYLDLESGKMLKNTTTPDGYFVAIDGSMATKK